MFHRFRCFSILLRCSQYSASESMYDMHVALKYRLSIQFLMKSPLADWFLISVPKQTNCEMIGELTNR